MAEKKVEKNVLQKAMFWSNWNSPIWTVVKRGIKVGLVTMVGIWSTGMQDVVIQHPEFAIVAIGLAMADKGLQTWNTY